MMDAAWYRGPIEWLFRFLPAEWLVQMPRATGWMRTAVGGSTPVCNPLYSVLTQSKRFPLIWQDLDIALPTWRRLLPETRSPREVPWRGDEAWIVKPALGHEGIRIGMAGVTTAAQWEEIDQGLSLAPDHWVAQRLFRTESLTTPLGIAYPCLGIYVIDDEVVGAYGRLSPHPLIDDSSWDVAVLLQNEVEESE
jgi:glutathionylspermidine synthase